MLKTLLILLALVVIIATLLPLLRYEAWWIRVFDFPRAQIAVLGLLTGMAYLYFCTKGSYDNVLLAVLLGCVLYQGYKMYPYTPFAAQSVLSAQHNSPDSSFSLLIANVLMTNRDSQAFLSLVAQQDLDVILTVETDQWWEEQLRKLEEQYPYTIKIPLNNTYGMLLHSRLRLVKPEIKFLVEADVPSIHTLIQLRSGDLISLHGLHPKPPYPKEATDTTERDAELLIVGKEIKQELEKQDRPTIVAGDLNDVAWSHSTTLFQKISGLLDPRIGRGMYNTFSAKHPLLRFPLDHVFHSSHFKLIALERLPSFGSDHFSVYIKLSLTPEAKAQQQEPQADSEDRQQAEEKIQEAQPREPL